MTSYELMSEALANFRRVWDLYYPPKGERRKRGTTLDISALQENWNAYMRSNISHHGKYRATTDPLYGQPHDHR